MRHAPRASIWRSAAAMFLAAASPAMAATVDGRIEAIIEQMTPRERVAQLMFVGFSGTRMNGEIRQLVSDLRVGGIVIYARNVATPQQLRALTAEIVRLSGENPPPLIAVDQEGGQVARVTDGAPNLPGQMALGATGSTVLARRAGVGLGASLARLGITLNLAPVVDLASPGSPVGIRAFSADPVVTGDLAAAFIRGQAEQGVASAAKHFPGIGTTREDSHDTLPAIGNSLEEMRRSHFAPFRAAIETGVGAVMVGHVAVPAIDGMTPATLSPRIIGVLRDELHFDGVVITDALEMRALDRKEGIGGLAVRSIAAGADVVMVLWHERDREEVLSALERAYRSGQLSDARIRDSLRRILRLKLARTPVTRDRRDDDVADEIAVRSVTLLRNQGALIPLRGMARRVYIGPRGPIADTVRAASSVTLPQHIQAEGVPVWSARARDAAAGAEVIIGVAQNARQLAAVLAAHEAQPSVPLILISLGSPQMITNLPKAAAYVCAYGYRTTSQRAVARLLAGQITASGRLPVAIPPYFEIGDGLTAALETRGPH